MKKYVITFISIFIFLLSTTAYAIDCSGDSRIHETANSIAHKIAKKYLGERQIDYEILRCELTDNELEFKVATTWRGTFYRNNIYREEGIFRVRKKSDGKFEGKYTTTYRNEMLRDWLATMGIAAFASFVFSE